MNDIDFTPNERIRWECLLQARDILGGSRSQMPNRGYIVTYNPKTSVEWHPDAVLTLAKEIFDWVTGRDQVAGYESSNGRNVFAYPGQSLDMAEYRRYFDSDDTSMRVFNLLSLQFAEGECQDIVGVLGDAGIRFVDGDESFGDRLRREFKKPSFDFIFDNYNPNWTTNQEANLLFLRQVQAHCNDKLAAQGHLFVNEVLDELRFDHTGPGAIMGWLNTDDHSKIDLHINPVGDNMYLSLIPDGPIYDRI